MSISIGEALAPAAIRPPVAYAERSFTIADLAALPAELPSGPVCYELDNGRLITMPPPGDIHGSIEGNFSAAFKIQGEVRGFGKARGEVGIILWRNPDRLVGADAAFIANRSLPLRRSVEGYLETIPDLAVEVRSKNDSWAAVKRKVEDYLKAGVRVVWVADPESRTVTEYRANTEPRVYQESDTLSVEDIIPGFQLSVAAALSD
jgi:Uma2 family endonuclease